MRNKETEELEAAVNRLSRERTKARREGRDAIAADREQSINYLKPKLKAAKDKDAAANRRQQELIQEAKKTSWW